MASVTSLGVHQPTGLRHAVEQRFLPPDPSPDLYQWDILDDFDGEDELLTTAYCVIWSRGSVFRKSFSFDTEGESITQALLTYFPTSEDDRQPRELDDNEKRSGSVPLSKALVVFLKTQAHIYFLSGANYVVHMPFEVDTACPAPCGVVIQRKTKTDSLAPVTLKFPRVPPNSFVSSQLSPVTQRTTLQTFSTAGLGNPKTLPLRLSSTLENMWEPPLETNESNWPRLVCLTDPLQELGLVVHQSETLVKNKRARGSGRSPFLHSAEEIVHIETVKLPGDTQLQAAEDLVLAVTLNRETNMYTVWRLTYIQNKDRFTQKGQKAKAKASRRRSSMQPGLNSGATTPKHPNFRESLGASLTVKKTRRSEKAEKAEKKSLDLALSLEPDKTGDATRRQSRRVSSILARADLSASHERAAFPDPGSTTGRRIDSHGSQRGRTSSGYTAMNVSGTYNQTLNSLLETPVDDVLEGLRSGGDFEGFHSMGLDDGSFDGLAKEILLTKIHSVDMENKNVRYSLSDLPARNQCKVFIVAGTPYAVDEEGRNCLLLCIQDPVDKRLQLLIFHVQVKRKFDLAAQAGRKPAPPSGVSSTTITWGELRTAQNVVDSYKVFHGDQTMILILSEGENGQRKLSIQAPWSILTTINMPRLFSEYWNNLAYAGRHAKKETKNRRSVGQGVVIAGISYPRSYGVIDIQDSDGRFHSLQIQLQPSQIQARRVLDVCRSVLPAIHAEKMTAAWWHVMQWLETTANIRSADREWTSIVILLFTVFLSLGDSDSSSIGDEANVPAPAPIRWHGPSHWNLMQLYSNPHAAVCPSWMQDQGWRWLADSPHVANLDKNENIPPENDANFLARHLHYARRYMSTSSAQPMGPANYLPTAASQSTESRKSAAWGIMMALHLLLEEQKLDVLNSEHMSPGPADLRVVLWQIAGWIQWREFVSWYELGIQGELQSQAELSIILSTQPPEPSVVPCIFQWIQSGLTRQSSESFPTLADVHASVVQHGHTEGPCGDRWRSLTPRTFMFKRIFDLKPFRSYADIVEALHACGFTPRVLDTLPESVLTPLQDAISMCQPNPPPSWSKDLLQLVNRGDINMALQLRRPPTVKQGGMTVPSHVASWDFRFICETMDDVNTQALDEVDGVERQMVVQALFKEDKRLTEAQNLLSSFKPRIIRLDPQPRWTESEYLEKQKDLVTTIATSTLALPAGRGMLQYGYRFPLLTQKFSIHGFNLTCLVKPSNVAVGVDKSLFTEEKVNWAFFHQGVAYGLAISPQAKGIDTSWILFNKPGNDLNNRHAGFLLALGLNGHLKSVAKWVAFKYLTPKHTMTSIGLLLGLAVSHLGTMDSLITRLLSVHVTRMLPRGAAELNLSHYTQTTGIMGIGLLYCNTQHRRMSEIMMSEIEHIEDEDEEDPLRNEGYRLASGFALGFINLGKGSDLKGLHDMRITEKLLTLATATKKVELVNVLDRSAAGAVVAITLIFMKTEDPIVARKIDVPDSALQFDYVRPDILLLRTVAKNLILWNRISPTLDWIRDSLPAEYQRRHKLGGLRRVQSRDLPFLAILAGLCFSIALRFAGSANTKVRDLLVHYLDHIMRIVRAPAEKFDAQLARGNARMCMDVVALSCAIVMAGTGDLVVLRRLRSLHGRDDPHTTYGSHLAAHMAIGALFLGCGTTTFGTSNLAVASLLVAFYPIFPANVQDNRSHLQAFRHFWVLATDARCLVTRDMATGQPVSVPIMIRMKSVERPPPAATATPTPKSRSRPPRATTTAAGPGSTPDEETVVRKQTPCLLPPLEEIASLRTDTAAQGYWNLEMDFERHPELIEAFRKNQNLYLRRRPAQDGVFAATLQALGRNPGGSTAAAAAAIAPLNLGSRAPSADDPLSWVFGLSNLKGLTHAERELVLDRLAAGGSEGATAGCSVDARLVLESVIDGSSHDGLLGLRLLFDWADRREGIPQRRDEENERKADDEGEGDGGSWWMRDSVIDALKGKVWLAGQDED